MSSPGTVRGDGELRLFLALRLPDEVLDGLVAWGEEHLPAARRVVREHLHVTLAFLGRRPSAEHEGILEALRATVAESAAFPLAPERWRETASVGMVVLADPSGAGARLAGDLHGRLEALGVYRPEGRPWLPHVTVLRFRERPHLHPPLPPMGTFVPSDAAAYISRLHPSGARYEVLQSYPLGG